MQKVIIFTSLITIFSCTRLPDAVGKVNEIVVITSPEDKDFVENLIFDLFSHSIYTPQPEPEFSLVFKNPWELDNVNTFGNLFIASLDFPEDSTGDILMQRLISMHKQDSPLFILGELYAKNQIICALHTLDAISMYNEVQLHKEWILNTFRNTLANRMELNIFKHGKNDLLSDQVMNIFGYTMDLPTNYTIIKSDSLKPFIWMGRGNPYRWITLHKSKKNKYISTLDAWKELTKVYSETLPNIHIGSYFRTTETLKSLNKKRKIMRGVYEHKESQTGGPFFVYIFDTERVDEVILVSGFINYPGHEKVLLLKQLELIANTLRKGGIK